jgi:TonB family protein
MSKWILLLITCFITFAAVSRAQTSSWVEVRSQHFVVVSNGTEEESRDAALQFERMRAVFQKLFPETNLDTATPALVLAIADRATMERLEPTAYIGLTQSYLAGLFLRWPERDYILVWLNAPGLHPYSPIYHEYTHFVLHRSGQWMPVWLDEGLAEYFKTTEIADDEIRIGKADARTVTFLEQNRLLPLATLFAVDQHSPYYHEDGKTSIFYSESWALTHYLKMKDSRDGRNHLADYLGYVQNGSDPVTAATRAFGNLDLLQSELQKYINSQGYAYSRMAGSVDVDSSSLVARNITPQEMDLARADFLAHDGRGSDGRALLDGVLRDEPGNVRALEIMGFLNIREHRFQEARQFCERAIKADDQSFLGHSCFALSSLQGSLPKSPTEQARIEQSLRTAIRVNPSFAPAYAELGDYLSIRAKYDEALNAARKAIQLEPGMVEFRIDEADVLLRMNHVTEGIGSLNFALKLAHAPEEVAAVETVLQSAQQYQAMRAKMPEPTVVTRDSASVTSKGVATVTPPRAIYSPGAEYTEEARQAKREGTCVLAMIVGIDGKPRNIVVTKPLGMGLDEKAIEAVQKWKFEPALRYGKPVPTRLNLSVTFKLFGGSSENVLQIMEKAKAGDPEAEFELANAFFEGKNVPKDEEKGLALLQRAAHDGLPQAQFEMGERTFGDGSNHESYVEAYVWYSLAQRGAVDHSDERLEALEPQMTPDQLSEAQDRLAKWVNNPGK